MGADRLRAEGLRVRGQGPYDLGLARGECVHLSGASGSGKTLLLRALADLDPHEGRVWLDGREQAEVPAPEWRRRVGMLPAEPRWWRETVGAHFRAPEAELAALGFGADVLGWSVERLSSGERQRLGLLRLLANRPDVLLLDEPTANVDPAGAARIEERVARHRGEAGASVVWVGHDPAQAARVADRALVLAGGRLRPAEGA